MIYDLKRMFHRITPLEMATQELVEAERSKLEAQTAQEYAASLCSYHEARIKRLKAYVKDAVQEAQESNIDDPTN